MAGRIWRLDIERESKGNVLILSISGRIGHGAAPEFALALAEARVGTSAVVLDFHGVDYISGPGIAALQAAADGALVLCRLTEPVRTALELAGVGDALAIEETRTGAVARLKRL